jgi:hypothetical protein
MAKSCMNEETEAAENAQHNIGITELVAIRKQK